MGKSGRIFFALVLGSATTACTMLIGLDDLGTEASPVSEPEAGEASSPSPPPPGEDAGVLGTVDATVVDACSATNCELLPDGFQLVALGASGAECPSGFAQPTATVEQPSFDPGACSCSCNVTQQPTCTLGGNNTITLLYGPPGSGTCAANGQNVSAGCSTEDFLGPFISYDRKYLAPAATRTGGSCNASAAKDESKLKTTPSSLCLATVIPQCEGKTCAPNTAPFAACIAATGTHQCPPSWPQRHVVGTSATLSCGAGCTCSIQGQCNTTGTLRYFATNNCSGSPGLTYPVDGGCITTPGSGTTTYNSHRYDPAPPTNVGCQSAGTPTPSATLAQETTVCCK